MTAPAGRMTAVNMLAPLVSAALLAQTQPAPAPSSDLLMTWSVILLGVAICLFVLEIFVPSGGIIGTAAAFCLVTGIILLSVVNTAIGLIAAILVLAALPFAIAFMLKIWPNTPIGRALTLKSPVPDEVEQERTADAAPSSAADRAALLGQHGTALTDLHPVGTCLIQGRREECLALGGMIHHGSQITVVAVDGMQIKVKAASR